MVLIHRGRGYVVLIAGVVAALLMNMFTNALFHDDREYYGTHVWPKFGTLWVAGLLCVAAGAYLRKHPTRVIDKDSIAGESARSHHLVRETRPLLLWQEESFFLASRSFNWGVIFFALGVIYFVAVYRRTPS